MRATRTARAARAIAVVVCLAALLVPVTSNADAGPHEIVGAGRSATGLLIWMDATDFPAPGGGTAMLVFPGGRQVLVRLNCVHVIDWLGNHAMGAYGLGDDGRVYFIGIIDQIPVDKIRVTNDASTGPCGASFPDRDIVPGFVIG